MPHVYFVGAESTGKTTLCRYVHRVYGLPIMPETARLVLRERATDFEAIRSSGAAANEYQRAVFERQIAQEMSVTAPYVSDRGPDNLAYASEYARNFTQLWRTLPPEYAQRLRESVVFFVRPQPDLLLAGSKDPERAKMQWDGLQRIDAKIELMLQLLDVSPHVLAEANSARREDQIDTVLRAYGYQKVTT